MRQIHKKKISIRHKFFKEELMFARGWTKHNPVMENPLDGISTGENEVFEMLQYTPGVVREVYYDYQHKKYVIKILNGAWYELLEIKLKRLGREK